MPRQTPLAILLVLAIAPVLGCGAAMSNAVSPDLVKKKAGSDLGCDAVTVENVASTSWKATGCGKTATYTCWTSPGMGEGMCTREGAMPTP